MWVRFPPGPQKQLNFINLDFIVEIYIVYAIQSEKDGRIYVGFSSNVITRLAQHNSGKTKSTKAYIPWILIYQEEVEGREHARKREVYLKSGVGKEFLKSNFKQIDR
jgi:putative endonuclease